MSSLQMPTATRLSRSAGYGRPAAPVRIVHLGLGNFFRAHQGWYTDNAADAGAWGIAAFTGRSPTTAESLHESEGLYTLITRGPEGDSFEVISSISSAHAAGDHQRWLEYWRSSELAVATLTVTEAGYARAADGGLDLSRADVLADIEALRESPGTPVLSAPGRLVAGILARRAAGAGPVAIVPCDNLPGNGAALRGVVAEFADLVDPSMAGWLAESVSFTSTMVDRITPATGAADRDDVLRATGLVDLAPVSTEPFSEWVIEGEFPAGRPFWDDAGARIVEDVGPFELRKLWLLNGAHSLLAYAGSALGHATVADAIGDPVCHGWVEQWWDEAGRHLPLPEAEVTAYRQALLVRFANPAIRHSLAQIAADGTQKIPARIVAALHAEVRAGRVPQGACRVIAAWVVHLRGQGAPVRDARADLAARLSEGTLADSVAATLAYLAPDLADHPELKATISARAADLIVRAKT